MRETFLAQTRKYEFNLECLRGIAALIVVIRHALLFPFLLQKGYTILPPWNYTPPGHLSVLLFFMLSGYVIGLTNARPLDSRKSILNYIRRRAVRLYPIYLISIAVTLAVAFWVFNKTYSPAAIVKHIVFLQVLLCSVFKENQALWSLNYEVFYYAFFIAISALRIKPVVVMAGAAMLALAATLFPAWVHPVFAAYAYGLIFWMAGLWLAGSRANKQSADPINYGQLLSFLFLFLSFERMNIFHKILEAAHFNVSATYIMNNHQEIVNFSDLAYLPFCLVAIRLFTNHKNRTYEILRFITYATPLLYFIYYLVSKRLFAPEGMSLAGTIGFYVISLLILLVPVRSSSIFQSIIIKLIPLGRLSYGIYVIHFPILLTIGSITFFTGHYLTYLTRLALYLFVTLWAGYILEIKLQPLFVKLFASSGTARLATTIVDSQAAP